MNRLKIEIDFTPYGQATPAGLQVTVATPVLLVDGQHLFKGRRPVLDTIDLLFKSTRSGEMELLTCTCGVSGCAGFHEGVAVRRVGDVVHWDIPRLGYGPVLAEHLNAPLTLSFELSALRQTLNALRQQLGAAADADPYLRLSPYDGREDMNWSADPGNPKEGDFQPRIPEERLSALFDRIEAQLGKA